MPTTRPRHMVTETEEIARVLDRAAARWPGLTRGQLLTMLLLEAGESQERRLDAERERLRSLLDTPDPDLVGIGSGEEIGRIRDEEWPE